MPSIQMKCIIFTEYFIFDFLLREWDKELERKASALKSEKVYNPSLTKAILRAFGFKFSLLGFFVFIEECVLRICQPLFMSWFIRSV